MLGLGLVRLCVAVRLLLRFRLCRLIVIFVPPRLLWQQRRRLAVPSLQL